jgi:hypothetical protein
VNHPVAEYADAGCGESETAEFLKLRDQFLLYR